MYEYVAVTDKKGFMYLKAQSDFEAACKAAKKIGQNTGAIFLLARREEGQQRWQVSAPVYYVEDLTDVIEGTTSGVCH